MLPRPHCHDFKQGLYRRTSKISPLVAQLAPVNVYISGDTTAGKAMSDDKIVRNGLLPCTDTFGRCVKVLKALAG